MCYQKVFSYTLCEHRFLKCLDITPCSAKSFGSGKTTCAGVEDLFIAIEDDFCEGCARFEVGSEDEDEDKDKDDDSSLFSDVDLGSSVLSIASSASSVKSESYSETFNKAACENEQKISVKQGRAKTLLMKGSRRVRVPEPARPAVVTGIEPFWSA